MEMKEEWLMPGAVVPVDAETTAALVAEIKRLIGVVGGMALGMQPAQEPVAWMFQHEETGRTMCVDAQQLEWGFEKGNPRLKKIAPLYTTPPSNSLNSIKSSNTLDAQRKPLTDEELLVLLSNVDEHAVRLPKGLRYFARAIEAAHGIKEQSLEALKYEEVLAAIDDLNQLDDFMESHWIEHDFGTGRINNVLCKILKQLKWKNHDS